MIENFEEIKEKEKLISNIEPIAQSATSLITSEEKVREIVEEPLQEAIIELIKTKGIETVSSSANKNDVKEGKGYIAINYDTLSEENKKILNEKGYETVEYGKKNKFRAVELNFSLSENTATEEVRKKSIEFVDYFKPQPANWIPEYSVEKIMQIWGYKPEEKDLFFKENTKPESTGYYFDTESQKYYDSKWLYEIKKNLLLKKKV